MKKVVVIGAGISGLSASIYARRCGFEVILCEQNSRAGGFCTSWRRKGYLFEGAVHWLTGSSPKIPIHQLWKETGALNDQVPIHLHEPFYTVEWEGRIISTFRDIEKTAEQFMALSPNDKPKIRRLVKDVKTLSRMRMPVTDIKGLKTQNPKRMSYGALFKMLPAFPLLAKLNVISCGDYALRFEHPGIRSLLTFLPEPYSAVSLIFTLATLDSGDGGYPEGGSLGMIERMVKTFEGLGGKLLLNTKVQKVNVTDGAANGVTLENGTVYDADAVIITQDTIAAVDQLFETPPPDAWLKELRETTRPEACTFIGVGIKAEIPAMAMKWKLEKPISCAGRTETEIGFNSYSGFDGYAPKGCTAFTTSLDGDTYDFWKQAKAEGRYDEEKQALADQINDAVCRKYPQAVGNIEVIDIATPLTYERYTGAYHGSWMSYTGVGEKMKIYQGFLESIGGLYFAGHRIVPPGGLPGALDTGRRAAQMACRRFDMLFK